MNFETEEFKNRLQAERDRAEEVLRKYAVCAEEGYQRPLLSAMNYSLTAGGKRLRPIFMHLVFELFADEKDNTVLLEHFMAAMEMIHTYSLVHDDLPAMDNDLYRRGRKTTHAVYGEAIGILAGDALLNRAYETACGAFLSCTSENDMKRVARALSILSEKAGVYGMVGGQTADVYAEKTDMPMDKEQLDFTIRLKTGALIEASFMIGAVLAGAGEEEVDRMERAASFVGKAFQIQDDILDMIGDEEKLGKPVGSDARNQKSTYVTLYGLEEAGQDVARYSGEALSLLEDFADSEFLRALIGSLINRNS
ncbi:MAG: polyprenyl synthetase family protein [Lachnospiraceae bacterium]|nr:polyprenyl synthetase family protein [Lachnospiraceae bacterium]